MESQMAKQEERRAATQAAVIAAAVNLFGAVGFDQTTIDDIAAEAGVAKGAVYHHFKSKRDVFEAAFESVSASLASAILTETRPDSDMIEMLMAATKAFFRLCADPATMRILLRDGPSVLGSEDWRRLDARHFGGLVTSALGMAMDAGAIKRQPLEPLSLVMLAAIQAAAIDCAAQTDFEASATLYLVTFENILAGLSAPRARADL